MNGTRDEARMALLYKLDAKVYHGTLSVMDALEAADAAGERAGLELAIKLCRSKKDNYHGAYHPNDCNCPRCYPSEKDEVLDAIIRALAAEGGGE